MFLRDAEKLIIHTYTYIYREKYWVALVCMSLSSSKTTKKTKNLGFTILT